jgi:hypothetical protein
MNSFDAEINTFLVEGTFTNNLDNVGNINLFTEPVVANQRYVAVPILNYVYKNDQIESLYDVTITEFEIPSKSLNNNTLISNKETIDQLSSENASLKDQLNAVIAASTPQFTDADVSAAKDIIIQLRIQLGEGKFVSDFSDEFPYLKL